MRFRVRGVALAVPGFVFGVRGFQGFAFAVLVRDGGLGFGFFEVQGFSRSWI